MAVSWTEVNILFDILILLSIDQNPILCEIKKIVSRENPFERSLKLAIRHAVF